MDSPVSLLQSSLEIVLHFVSVQWVGGRGNSAGEVSREKKAQRANIRNSNSASLLFGRFILAVTKIYTHVLSWPCTSCAVVYAVLYKRTTLSTCTRQRGPVLMRPQTPQALNQSEVAPHTLALIIQDTLPISTSLSKFLLPRKVKCSQVLVIR